MDKNDSRIIRIQEPMQCVILERVNRFVVKVLLDGKPRRAYINNTGRLVEYLVKGGRGFCIRTKRTEKTD